MPRIIEQALLVDVAVMALGKAAPKETPNNAGAGDGMAATV
jgi:hypothetical protein